LFCSISFVHLSFLQIGKPFEVSAELAWAEDILVRGSSNLLTYEMSIDGKVSSTGEVDLNESRSLPTSIKCGTATMDASGKHTVQVVVSVDAFESAPHDREYQSFNAGASFVPLVFVLVVAASTHMVSQRFSTDTTDETYA
jgi:hypothetical protein